MQWRDSGATAFLSLVILGVTLVSPARAFGLHIITGWNVPVCCSTSFNREQLLCSKPSRDPRSETPSPFAAALPTDPRYIIGLHDDCGYQELAVQHDEDSSM
jgi:hypothetical protein